MKKIFIISLLILIIDFISKELVVNFMIENDSISLINNFFSLTYVKNIGVAFSLLEGHIGIVVVATIIILFLLFRCIKDGINNKWEIFGYGFIIGGAVGNLLDRLLRGYVIDFFDFNLFGYNAPIFNVADIFIVIGVILLIIFGRNGEK